MLRLSHSDVQRQVGVGLGAGRLLPVVILLLVKKGLTRPVLLLMSLPLKNENVRPGLEGRPRLGLVGLVGITGALPLAKNKFVVNKHTNAKRS